MVTAIKIGKALYCLTVFLTLAACAGGVDSDKQNHWGRVAREAASYMYDESHWLTFKTGATHEVINHVFSEMPLSKACFGNDGLNLPYARYLLNFTSRLVHSQILTLSTEGEAPLAPEFDAFSSLFTRSLPRARAPAYLNEEKDLIFADYDSYTIHVSSGFMRALCQIPSFGEEKFQRISGGPDNTCESMSPDCYHSGKYLTDVTDWIAANLMFEGTLLWVIGHEYYHLLRRFEYFGKTPRDSWHNEIQADKFGLLTVAPWELERIDILSHFQFGNAGDGSSANFFAFPKTDQNVWALLAVSGFALANSGRVGRFFVGMINRELENEEGSGWHPPRDMRQNEISTYWRVSIVGSLPKSEQERAIKNGNFFSDSENNLERRGE